MAHCHTHISTMLRSKWFRRKSENSKQSISILILSIHNPIQLCRSHIRIKPPRSLLFLSDTYWTMLVACASIVKPEERHQGHFLASSPVWRNLHGPQKKPYWIGMCYHHLNNFHSTDESFVLVQLRPKWGPADGGIRPICLNCLNCLYQPPAVREIRHIKNLKQSLMLGIVCFRQRWEVSNRSNHSN